MDQKTWTNELVAAVDSLDAARAALSDLPGGRAPTMRDELLALHALALRVVEGGDRSDARAMGDAAFALKGRVMDLRGHLERVYEALDEAVQVAVELDDDAETAPMMRGVPLADDRANPCPDTGR